MQIFPENGSFNWVKMAYFIKFGCLLCCIEMMGILVLMEIKI
jgi:hypothetical protein